MSQYLENVPAAGGSRPANTIHVGGGGGGAVGGGGSGGSGGAGGGSSSGRRACTGTRYEYWITVEAQHRPTGFVAEDPASPACSWTSVDAAVRNLSARCVTVLMMLYLAPIWAQGANPPGSAGVGTWGPSLSRFGAFAKAAATRYSGFYPDPEAPGRPLPRVGYWQGWNEPNLVFDVYDHHPYDIKARPVRR